MLLNLVLVLAIKFIITSSVDVERLQTYPIPMKNLDLKRYTGYWYMQGRYIPCSWGGSKTFTDFVFYVQLRGYSYTIHTYWRQNDICTDVFSEATVRSPGIFQQKDSIGNMYSGVWYLVETDYKRYSVSYGCTKPSVTGKTCSDYYISLETRRQHPDPYTMAKIDQILKQKFGLSLNNFIIVSHKNPCVKAPSIPPPNYSHLSKKY